MIVVASVNLWLQADSPASLRKFFYSQALKIVVTALECTTLCMMQCFVFAPQSARHRAAPYAKAGNSIASRVSGQNVLQHVLRIASWICKQVLCLQWLACL
jgi:hypothetical protein